MTMATRCTSCGTIFRVAQDQLKVSEGWVRCGRCDEVFNAIGGLFDLDRESPPIWTKPSTEQVRAALEQRREVYVETGEQTVAELDEEDRIASRFFRPEQDDVERSPAESVAERDRVDFADAQFNTEFLADAESDAKELELAVSPKRSKKSKSSRSSRSAKARKANTPSFLRLAEQQARWRTPLARTLLSTVSLLLLAVLALQMAHHFRDLVAAQWPQTQPLLTRWCALANCHIQAPQRIDDITVESTALSRVTPDVDSFRLSITLRNHGTLPVTTPSFELSLTDGSGQLLARRALMAADFHQTSDVIPANNEMAFQSLISTGTMRVAGYTVEVFYP